MDVVLLSRIQFAVTIAFHYIYPPMSIGLGVMIVVMEGIYLKTRNPIYERMTRFWVKIFGLIFAMGVATGIVMEFEFGTNWATYSRFVGDVFGSALAAEGIFAFFLESTFLGLLLFGWDKVKPGMHFFAAIMVMLGAHFSAVWIVVANSWQQTPAGFHIVGEGLAARAEITNFWEMVFNPSSLDRLSHVLSGAWMAGAFLVVSVSAYYLLQKKHVEIGKMGLKIGLIFALVSGVLQIGSGHSSAIGVSKNQPAKLAALEAHYDSTKPGDLYLFGWVDTKNEKVIGLALPKFLSVLITGDSSKPIIGLDSFSPEDRPPVQIVFQSYHVMVGIGFGLFGLTLFCLFYWWRGKLFDTAWLLWICVLSVLGPQAANQLGWISAEVGRQPWIVYHLLRTSDGISKVVQANQVLGSLIMFTLIYMLLFVLFLYLFGKKIQKGPEAEAKAAA